VAVLLVSSFTEPPLHIRFYGLLFQFNLDETRFDLRLYMSHQLIVGRNFHNAVILKFLFCVPQTGVLAASVAIVISFLVQASFTMTHATYSSNRRKIAAPHFHA